MIDYGLSVFFHLGLTQNQTWIRRIGRSCVEKVKIFHPHFPQFPQTHRHRQVLRQFLEVLHFSGADRFPFPLTRHEEHYTNQENQFVYPAIYKRPLMVCAYYETSADVTAAVAKNGKRALGDEQGHLETCAMLSSVCSAYVDRICTNK